MVTKKKVEKPPNTYYDLVYRSRTMYTSHHIPVRVALRNSKTYNTYAYFEAYIIAPAVPDENPEKKKTEAKIISLPTGMKHDVWIAQSRIYPTGRSMMQLDSEKLVEVPAVIGQDYEEFWPVPLKWSKSGQLDIMKTHPNSKWTEDELQSLLGRGPNDSHKPANLKVGECIFPTGSSRRCRITNKVQPTYQLEELVTLQAELIDGCRTLKEVTADYQNCQKCPLGDIRRKRGAHLVFGRGSEKAVGMIIAESPWEQEERDNIPLHPEAPAGSVLHSVMKEQKLYQHEWYLTNAIICRPLKNPGAGLEKNKPSIGDIKACSARLKETLRIVSPKLVVLLGKTAYRAWFGKDPDGVFKSEGWVSIPFGETGKVTNYHVYFVRHPSSIARDTGTEREVHSKKKYREHWTQIARKYKELCQLQ